MLRYQFVVIQVPIRIGSEEIDLERRTSLKVLESAGVHLHAADLHARDAAIRFSRWKMNRAWHWRKWHAIVDSQDQQIVVRRSTASIDHLSGGRIGTRIDSTAAQRSIAHDPEIVRVVRK